MNGKKTRAYEVLLRIAHVREVRAGVALAVAAREEAARHQDVDDLTDARNAASIATRACAIDDARLDVARYALLSELGMALTTKLTHAQTHLDDAQFERVARANENVVATRRVEKVADRLDAQRGADAYQLAAKRQEEAVELWVETGKEGA